MSKGCAQCGSFEAEDRIYPAETADSYIWTFSSLYASDRTLLIRSEGLGSPPPDELAGQLYLPRNPGCKIRVTKAPVLAEARSRKLMKAAHFDEGLRVKAQKDPASRGCQMGCRELSELLIAVSIRAHRRNRNISARKVLPPTISEDHIIFGCGERARTRGLRNSSVLD